MRGSATDALRNRPQRAPEEALWLGQKAAFRRIRFQFLSKDNMNPILNEVDGPIASSGRRKVGLLAYRQSQALPLSEH